MKYSVAIIALLGLTQGIQRRHHHHHYNNVQLRAEPAAELAPPEAPVAEATPAAPAVEAAPAAEAAPGSATKPEDGESKKAEGPPAPEAPPAPAGNGDAEAKPKAEAKPDKETAAKAEADKVVEISKPKSLTAASSMYEYLVGSEQSGQASAGASLESNGNVIQEAGKPAPEASSAAGVEAAKAVAAEQEEVKRYVAAQEAREALMKNMSTQERDILKEVDNSVKFAKKTLKHQKTSEEWFVDQATDPDVMASSRNAAGKEGPKKQLEELKKGNDPRDSVVNNGDAWTAGMPAEIENGGSGKAPVPQGTTIYAQNRADIHMGNRIMSSSSSSNSDSDDE